MKDQIDGIIACHVSLRIDAREMRDWEPARIAAFFDGLAKAIEASNNSTPAKRGAKR